MSAAEVHFTSESDSAELHRRSVGTMWRARLLLLFVSLVAGLGLAGFYHVRRVIPDQIALGKAVQVKPAVWRGTPVNAHRLDDYPSRYPPASGDRLWLWLGNSQLHSINQLREADQIAVAHASDEVGLPVFGLSLPNASLREHLLAAAWALSRPGPTPEWLIVGVVYDDLREYSPRAGWSALLDDAARRTLTGEEGRRLLREVDADAAAQDRDAQGTTRAGRSLQEICESRFNAALGAVWPMWRFRDQAYAALMTDLRRLRLWVFQIDATTKRPMMAARTAANMAALDELLALARGRGVNVLVYIAPLRWDVEAPYVLEAYDAWKPEVAALCERHGAHYADLDRIVPDADWGAFDSGEIDFMHFQGEGHRILAARIVAEVRRAAASPGG